MKGAFEHLVTLVDAEQPQHAHHPASELAGLWLLAPFSWKMLKHAGLFPRGLDKDCKVGVA